MTDAAQTLFHVCRGHAVGLTPGPKLDRLALGSLATARSNPLWRKMDETVRTSLPGVAQRFAAALPDFRCDFPIYAY